MTVVKCKDCRHSIPAQSPQQVICTRFPPTPFLINISRDDNGRLAGTETVSISPVMGVDQSCGEASRRVSK